MFTFDGCNKKQYVFTCGMLNRSQVKESRTSTQKTVTAISIEDRKVVNIEKKSWSEIVWNMFSANY